MTKDNVFDTIQPLLVKAIQEVIESLEHDKDNPLCIFRIYYYDTHAPCTYLDFRCVTVDERQKILDSKEQNALFYLWASGEVCGFRPSSNIPNDPAITEQDIQFERLFKEVYELLCADDDDYMKIFRSTLQGVALHLNTLDWQSICPVSDDFVIVPADGSQYFADDSNDIANSIPTERLALLRERELLGVDADNWQSRPGYGSDEDSDEVKHMIKMIKDIEEHALSLSELDRIAYWIDQLDMMAAGQECDMTRIEVNAGYPLDHIAEIGNHVAVPLMKLACKWANKSEWIISDKEDERPQKTPMSKVMLELIWKVKKLKYANQELEMLLRDFLKKSSDVNAGKTLWGTLPYHCADALHELFDKYPEPDRAGNNALIEPEQFLNVPLS